MLVTSAMYVAVEVQAFDLNFGPVRKSGRITGEFDQVV